MTLPTGPKRPLSRLAVGALVVAVVFATAAGATIGATVALIYCESGCAPPAVASGVLGAALAAVGTAIIGVLVARAFAEWDEIKRRAPEA